MQKLCAKPQHNGGQHGEHAGGLCALPATEHPRPPGPFGVTETPNSGLVGFDAGAQVNPVLANPRVFLGCFYKSFCSDGPNASSIQPVNNWFLMRTHLVRSQNTHQIAIDIKDNFTSPLGAKNDRFGTSRVDTVTVHTEYQIEFTMSTVSVVRDDNISLYPANRIMCRGALPSFPLPAPFGNTNHGFSSLQSMCVLHSTHGYLPSMDGRKFHGWQELP